MLARNRAVRWDMTPPGPGSGGSQVVDHTGDVGGPDENDGAPQLATSA